jgi:hypothetical protein
VTAELDPQVPNAGLVEQGDERSDELDLVLDKMMFADEDDVVVQELADDVGLGRQGLVPEICFERRPERLRDFGQRFLLGGRVSRPRKCRRPVI